jgi:hypothetical protein
MSEPSAVMTTSFADGNASSTPRHRASHRSPWSSPAAAHGLTRIADAIHAPTSKVEERQPKEEYGAYWATLQDPEGNELCIGADRTTETTPASS